MNGLSRKAELLKFLVQRHFVGIKAPVAPDMEPILLDKLDQLLSASAFYLEFGSGGSTVHAARAGIPTLSVESDPYFARAMRRETAGCRDLTILHADIGFTGPRGFPLVKRAGPRRVAKWRNYISQPFDHLARRDVFPDLILVDGRFRRACALESARQAALSNASAILLFDDYRDRPSYHRVEKWLGAPLAIGRAALFRIGRGRSPAISEADVSQALLEME